MTAEWADEFEHLLFDRREHGVMLVTINRPEVGNAVNSRLHLELGSVWAHIDQDESVAVAVITGAGQSFCTGGEAGTFDTGPELASAALDATMFDIQALVMSMVNCRKPIISAVNGGAFASGMALALAADISIVGEGTRFNDAHLGGGMVAGDHAALLWPLYTSLAKARYYLLSGYSLSGEEAERIGLVSCCVADNEVVGRALKVAERIATNAQFAVRWTKRSLNAWVRQQAPLFELSTALQMLSLMGPDSRAGMEAILRGEKPQFPSVLP
jgi:enoyl-CoA hydratase